MIVCRVNRIRNLAIAAVFMVGVYGAAEDWPTYQHDIARSGVSKEGLRAPLSEEWVYTPAHPPAPGWGDPAPKPMEGNLELPRVKFDDAFHVAAVEGAVYFGSSSDNTVYCLDAETGKVKWTRITGAPIRLAPTVWKGKVLVGSDDGHAYCLDAKDGREIWKFRAAPTAEKVLGHGKMVSIWPIRTGILVDDGIAYFAAGIFPHEGLYLYAVNVENGKRVWVNDSPWWTKTSGGHSPQGYLLASATNLFVPSGRAAPAAFDREDGHFLYQSPGGNWRAEGLSGGTYALLAGDHLYSGTEQIVAYGQKGGKTGFAWFHGRRLVVTPDVSYMLTESEMSALDRKAFPQASRERQELRRKHSKLLPKQRALKRSLRTARKEAEKNADAAKKIEALEKQMAELKSQLDTLTEAENKVAKTILHIKKWRVDCDCSESLILAGKTLFAGGEGKVIAVDAATGRKLWTGKVDGKAKGLAVANGRLFVSTDKGNIHCFGVKEVAEPKRVSSPEESAPYPDDDQANSCKAMAESIVTNTAIKRGYCLIIGAGTGRLAYELAKRTDLMIYGVEEDAKKVKQARKALSAAGLYGTRVCVDQGTLKSFCYPDYFANLIVLENETAPVSAEEIVRVLKPCGGVAYLPKSFGDPLGKLKRPDIRIATKGNDRIMVMRGELKGAGSWTHQYAEPGNTACSDDQLVKCPLGLLWFGEPGPGRMPNRHACAPAPLSINGRLFIQGENVIMAYDAYNGLKLWEREIPGAKRTVGWYKQDCGNMAASKDSLFVAVKDTCLRLDQATGETKMTYDLPPSPDGKPRKWGYVALVGDTLYGSATPSRMSADALFALDTKTGQPRWVHYGKSIGHISIAIGDGKVFFIESAVTQEHRNTLKAPKDAIVRLVVALDAETGKVRWQKPVDLTDCVKVGPGSGDAVTVIYRNKVLLLCMAPWNGHFWKEFYAGKFSRRSIIALSSDKGEELWSDRIGYRSRPLVVGDTIYAEPWAHDLRTGKAKMRVRPVTGQQAKWDLWRPGHHCGFIAAAPNCLLFRSTSIAYYDLIADDGVANFGSQRPGCWINFIAANGLLLVPEASSGCVCAFPIHCTVVLHPRKKERAWRIYSSPGPTTPAKHFAVNLGAPGDRTDSKGTLWLAYPRLRHGRTLQFRLDTGILDEGGYYTHNPDLWPVTATDRPWVFTSGCSGLTRCAIPLVGKGEAPGEYTVRLSFAEWVHDRAGQRVFDIKLQDRLVVKDFDIFKEARGRNKAVVKEFKGIEVADSLRIDLVPSEANPKRDQAPTLCGIEAIRTNVLPLSLAAPPFLLRDYQPEQTQQVRIINLTDKEFVGELRASAPAGIRVEPTRVDVRIAPKSEEKIDLKAGVTDKMEAGQYEMALKLTGQGGEPAVEKSVLVEYTITRGEVLKAVQDAVVREKAPSKNFGTAKSLSVDGGSKKMGDGDVSIIFLKFRMEIPGKPVSARLRLQVGANRYAGSWNAGNICLIKGPWDEKTVTYATRPEIGRKVGALGKIASGERIERDLDVNLEGLKEISLAIVPVNIDGAGFLSREGDTPPELVVEIDGGR